MSITLGSTFADGHIPLHAETVIWQVESRIPFYLAHPSLREAIKFTSHSLQGMYRGNRLLNRIMNDRGRIVFGLLCLYLSATPDGNGVGLTVTRIVDLCETTGVCSRGRAKAMLTLMQWAGYLAAAPTGANRRQRPLVPTERFLHEQVRRWRSTLGGLALMEPHAQRILAHLDDRTVFMTLMRHLGDRYRAGFRPIHFAPQLRPLIERDAGALLAFTLINAGDADDTYPPSRALGIPVAVLAREFHVSRAHVLKLLREAELNGLIFRSPGHQGSLLLLPPMRDGMLHFFAAVFALQADAVHATLAELDLLRDERPSL